MPGLHGKSGGTCRGHMHAYRPRGREYLWERVLHSWEQPWREEHSTNPSVKVAFLMVVTKYTAKATHKRKSLFCPVPGHRSLWRNLGSRGVEQMVTLCP